MSLKAFFQTPLQLMQFPLTDTLLTRHLSETHAEVAPAIHCAVVYSSLLQTLVNLTDSQRQTDRAQSAQVPLPVACLF